MPGNFRPIPLSVIEGWPKPNYVDPVSRSGLTPLTVVLQAIMTIMVGTRFWLRATNKAGPLGFDDALLVPAFLGATVFTTCVLLSTVQYDTDRHIWDVPVNQFEPTVLIAWISEVAFLTGTCSAKVSVLLFNNRLVHGTNSRRWKYLTIGAIIFTVAYGLTFLFLLIFACQPTEAYWKVYSLHYNKPYHCTTTPIFNPLSGALSVFSDLYSVLLPMCMLRHFEAPKRQKAALYALFSLGFLVAIVGIVRTFYLSRLSKSYDTTWVGYDTYIWSVLEIQLVLICVSAPALRVLFRRYLSDPVSRMLHTPRPPTSAGGAHLESKHSSFARVTALAAFSPRSHTSSRGSGELGETNLIRHETKPSLDTVREMQEDASSPSTIPSEPYSIKTPADFEAYALDNLERNRPPWSPSFRPASRNTYASVEGSFTEWSSLPKPPKLHGEP